LYIASNQKLDDGKAFPSSTLLAGMQARIVLRSSYCKLDLPKCRLEMWGPGLGLIENTLYVSKFEKKI